MRSRDIPATAAAVALAASSLGLAACAPGSAAAQGSGGAPDLSRINHVVVIYQENWSFDSLYPHFPGAENIDSPAAKAALRQVDKSGQPITVLPPPLNSNNPDPDTHKPSVDTRFPAGLPVGPFDLNRYVAPTDRTGDLVHRFYQEQYQIDAGRNDGWLAWTDAGGLVFSYYDAGDMPEGRLAREFTMDDHFFHAAYGGSFINHFWMVCACTPTFPAAPDAIRAQLDSSGVMSRDGQVTPDGFAVNTTYSVNAPHPASAASANLLPVQTMPNIGDRLTAKNLSWAWYAGGWNDALAGRADPLFQFHHQPFVYFQTTADGTPAKSEHLKDETDFMSAARAGTLPAVAFVKPLGPNNEHPGYASLLAGQQHVADLVKAIRTGPQWKDTAIVITYDENGGRWDHVAPTRADRWGPGTRVPAIVISPYARAGYVDHNSYDTTAILATIEHRWGLAPLGSRDAAMRDLSASFDFTQSPRS